MTHVARSCSRRRRRFRTPRPRSTSRPTASTSTRSRPATSCRVAGMRSSTSLLPKSRPHHLRSLFLPTSSWSVCRWQTSCWRGHLRVSARPSIVLRESDAQFLAWERATASSSRLDQEVRDHVSPDVSMKSCDPSASLTQLSVIAIPRDEPRFRARVLAMSFVLVATGTHDKR